MDNRDLCRVFDQVKLPPEREKAMLDRLLQEERETRPVKKIRKLTAVLVAAALLLLACAFTVATGLDQRLLDHIGAGPEDVELLPPFASVVEITSSAEDGSAMQVTQVLADQHSLLMLVDFIAPENVVLDGSYDFDSQEIKLVGQNGKDSRNYSYSSSVQQLDDENPGDNRLTFMVTMSYDVLNIPPEAVQFHFGDLTVWEETEKGGQPVVLIPGEWSFKIQLSGEDTGWSVQLNQPLQLESGEVTVTEVYLSPLNLYINLKGDVVSAQKVDPSDFEELYSAWWYSITLQDKNGDSVPIVLRGIGRTSSSGSVNCRLADIIDPSVCEGGALTICGQTFSLNGLAPAEN